jgi:hypothetical protein
LEEGFYGGWALIEPKEGDERQAMRKSLESIANDIGAIKSAMEATAREERHARTSQRPPAAGPESPEPPASAQ